MLLVLVLIVAGSSSIGVRELSDLSAEQRLSERRGGDTAAADGAIEAQAFASNAQQKAEKLNSNVEAAKKAAATNEAKIQLDAARLRNESLQFKLLQSNESLADKVFQERLKSKEKAETDKLAADALLKAAYSKANKTAAVHAALVQQLNSAVGAEDQDKEAISQAEQHKKQKMAVMQTAMHEYMEAKKQFSHADHQLALLTGTAKHGESVEAYQARRERSVHNTTVKAILALDAAILHAAQTLHTSDRAKTALKNVQHQQEQLRRQAATAENQAEELKATLEKAKENGSVTKEMEKAAEEAASAAEKTRDLLNSGEQQLANLHAQSEAEDGKSTEASKKLESLEKITAAEKSLLNQQKLKMIHLAHDKNIADRSVVKQTVATAKAKRDASEAKQQAEKSNMTLAQKMAKLGNDLERVQEETAIAKKERDERDQLMKKQEATAHVSIPQQIDVDEAKQMLDEKGNALKELTRPLTDTIDREKDALAKKSEAQKEARSLQVEVKIDQNKTQQAEKTALRLQKKQKDESELLNVVELRSEAATNAVADSNNQERDAEQRLHTTEKETGQAALAARREEQRDEELKKSVKEAVRHMQVEESDGEEIERAKLETVSDLKQQLAIDNAPTAFAPTAAPATVLKMNSTLIEKVFAEAATTAPTPPPTALVQRLMAIMHNGKNCGDHNEWHESCPYLEDHCKDFMTMKIFCMGTCKLCGKY